MRVDVSNRSVCVALHFVLSLHATLATYLFHINDSKSRSALQQLPQPTTTLLAPQLQQQVFMNLIK